LSRYYGTATYHPQGGCWDLAVEPQVSLRVKRWFEKAVELRGGLMRLTDTQENCRELEVILGRYPLIVSHPEHLFEQARAFDHRQALISNILAKDYEPKEFELARPLRDYQRVAIDLLIAGGELICADQVGLGKTIVSIGSFRAPGALPALVVTKTDLPEQWEERINEFAPDLRVHIIRKAQPYGLRHRQVKGQRVSTRGPQDLAGIIERGEPFPDVVLTTYSRLNPQWAAVLKPYIRSVHYDEIQEMRTGPGTQRYGGAQELLHTTRYRCGLSATPIYNLGGEIYDVVGAISDTALGTQEEFRREWCRTSAGGKVVIKDPVAFGSYLRERGLMIRRTRGEVGRELPPCSIIPHAIQANLDELKHIHTDAARLADLIVNRRGSKDDRFRAGSTLDWKLRQATGIAKAPYVAEFVRAIVEGGEKVALYGWHHETYSLWKDLLADLGPVFYTGGQTVPVKRANVERFKTDPSCKVLVLSLRAGAGLDGLQGYVSNVVFGELDWSPGVHTQCIGRVHRDGQELPVSAYFLHCQDGSDPVLMDALGVKRSQADGVVDLAVQTGGILAGDEEFHSRKLAAYYLKRHGGLHTEPEEIAS
jgi:SNF2 family DNA or RNA helicase